MKQFKAEWQDNMTDCESYLQDQHNALCDYLEENQWQRDNVYAEGFNDGAYQQRNVNKDTNSVDIERSDVNKKAPLFKAEADRFHGETLNPHDSRVEMASTPLFKADTNWILDQADSGQYFLKKYFDSKEQAREALLNLTPPLTR